ncbi:hypothetical protein [Streptomyces canus]|uniref:hypothetical protein n=1 Tax=Streptomyces canus TaxID=58343 RepID=UPI0033A6314A
MAVVMTFSWPEITPDVYDAVRKKVRWEEDAPDGCVLHAAWFVHGGLNVMDIWESEDHFNRFIEARIAPYSRANWACKATPNRSSTPCTVASSPLGSAAPAPEERLHDQRAAEDGDDGR